MQQVLHLSKWEWFKLRRLRMPWVLLAIALLVSQLAIWTNYLAYHNDTVQEVIAGGPTSFSLSWGEGDQHVSVTMTCVGVVNDRMPSGFEQLPEGLQEDFRSQADAWRGDGTCDSFQAVHEFRKGFTLPNSIAASVSGFASTGPLAIGPLLAMLLAASLGGSEYGWGTLRTVLTGGISRWKFLSAKLLLLLRLCAGVLIVIGLLAVASSLIAAFVPPDETGELADSGSWPDVIVVFFKALYGFLPFIGLSVFATVLTSSRSVGIAVSVGYLIVESIVAPLLRLSDTLANVADYLLVQSFRSWTAVPVVEGTDLLQAFVVIFAYTVFFVAATSWIFKRRDIVGAVGD